MPCCRVLRTLCPILEYRSAFEQASGYAMGSRVSSTSRGSTGTSMQRGRPLSVLGLLLILAYAGEKVLKLSNVSTAIELVHTGTCTASYNNSSVTFVRRGTLHVMAGYRTTLLWPARHQYAACCWFCIGSCSWALLRFCCCLCGFPGSWVTQLGCG
jgi:hypothetical protein